MTTFLLIGAGILFLFVLATWLFGDGSNGDAILARGLLMALVATLGLAALVYLGELAAATWGP